MCAEVHNALFQNQSPLYLLLALFQIISQPSGYDKRSGKQT